MKKLFYIFFRKSILKFLSEELININSIINSFDEYLIRFVIPVSDYCNLRNRIANKIESYDNVLNALFDINLEYKFEKEHIGIIEIYRKEKRIDFIKYWYRGDEK